MKKILVVDDQKQNRYLLQTLLEGHNYVVGTAVNGTEALAMARQKSPDMIITDVLMPDMDGFQLCRELKKDETLKDIPVIFYSATYTDSESQKLALDIGAVDYLLKPQDPDVFIKIINKVWDKYGEKKQKPLKKPLDEKVYMKIYNERLIQKLEKKMLSLKESEQHSKHLYSSLSAIRGVTQLIIKEKNKGMLIDKVCNTLIKALGYNAVWIGLLEDEKTFTKVVGFSKKEDISRFCKQMLVSDRAPCINKAFTNQEVLTITDRLRDCQDCLLLDTCEGEQSVIMRIEYDNKLFGFLAINLKPGNTIINEEQCLLKDVVSDIGFGLHNIEITETLNKYREQLEDLVKERTNRLEKKTKELKEANLKLQELDQLKTMFIASMSHELRTPLNTIIGFTGIMLQELSGAINEEQRKQLALVKNSANNLLVLINDIIDISKIETNQAGLDIQNFDLSQVVLEIKDFFIVAAETKKLRLLLETPSSRFIVSDERKIGEILINLISNAIKFTDKGAVKIKVTKKETAIEIAVIDTGIGTKKEDMNKLFKTFSRIPTRDKLKEGTGLGLYLSRKKANLLGGDITAESEYRKGSEYTLILPLKPQKQQSSSKEVFNASHNRRVGDIRK